MGPGSCTWHIPLSRSSLGQRVLYEDPPTNINASSLHIQSGRSVLYVWFCNFNFNWCIKLSDIYWSNSSLPRWRKGEDSLPRLLRKGDVSPPLSSVSLNLENRKGINLGQTEKLCSNFYPIVFDLLHPKINFFLFSYSYYLLYFLHLLPTYLL